jgi:hypothetical protein
MPEYRLMWPQMEWWNDQFFNNYLLKFQEIDGLNTHRKWTLWQLLRLVENVKGDTAECGVFKAASSWLICCHNQKNSSDKIHHMFDSFEGLSLPNDIDEQHWKKGDLAVPENIVIKNLKEFSEKITINKGWIPEKFSDYEERIFSFVHIDVDLYQPTKDSINFFYDRMSPGGIILCDDYGFTSCPGATKSIDEFLNDKPEKMISLADGGGFMIKGVQTSLLKIEGC